MTFVHHGFGKCWRTPKKWRLNLRKSRSLPDTVALPVLPSDCESAGGATGRKHPQAYARKKLRFHKFRINSWLPSITRVAAGRLRIFDLDPSFRRTANRSDLQQG